MQTDKKALSSAITCGVIVEGWDSIRDKDNPKYKEYLRQKELKKEKTRVTNKCPYCNFEW